MASQNVSVSDSISRILGVGALLVAIGGGFYLYQENQQLRSDLANVSTAPDDPEAYQKFVQAWDGKLTHALTEFNKQADTATKEFDAAREARDRIFQAAMEQEGAEKEGTEEVGRLSQTEVEDLIKDQIAALRLPAPEPELRTATTVLRPSEDGALPIPSIRNVGDVDAEIVAARFRPRKGSEFVVKSMPLADEENQVVIQFGPDHNVGATIEGAHRFYERTYVLPQQVVAQKQTVKVTIEIRANNRHLDWAMMGDLELEYQDGRTVLIPNACAVFVPDPEETT